LAGAAAATTLLAGGLVLGSSSPAFAEGCQYTWAYPGGSTSWGGCKGSWSNGSTFVVITLCGNGGWYHAYGRWTYAPSNVGVSAQGGNCPWYASGVRGAVVNSY
jgi:hypothetical protein